MLLNFVQTKELLTKLGGNYFPCLNRFLVGGNCNNDGVCHWNMREVFGSSLPFGKVNMLNLRSCDQSLCCYWLFGNWILALIPRWLCTNWNTDCISLDIISCCGDLEDFIRNHFNYTSCQKHGTLHSITRVWKIIFCSHFSVQYAWETFNCWEIVRCNSLYN